MAEEKKRFHIATLGLYRNNLVDYVIRRCQVDKIGIIYTEKNEEDLRKIREENDKLGIPVVSKEVLPWDYYNILAGILELISEHEETEEEDFLFEFNISCGTRVMTSAAYLAALSTDSKVYFAMNPYAEKPGGIVKIEPVSVVNLTEPKRKILENLNAMGGSTDSQRNLGTRTELGASSVSKHVKEMQASGYVDKSKHGKTTKIELTKLGSIILNLKKFRKKSIWGNNCE